MHTHGTAVLDRPAEATVPASTSLPALTPRANALDSQSANGNSPATALPREPEIVLGLGYGELAVALYASGVRPRLFRSASTAQLIEWAAQGLSLLGIDRVRHNAARTRHLNLRLIDNCTTARDEAEHDTIWPCNERTRQSCTDAAYQIMYILNSPASPATPTSRTAR